MIQKKKTVKKDTTQVIDITRVTEKLNFPSLSALTIRY